MENTFLLPIRLKIYKDSYIRLRGTNTEQLEPAADPRGEVPWTELWFYSNPIFMKSSK
jgi:hypothetical protein